MRFKAHVACPCPSGVATHGSDDGQDECSYKHAKRGPQLARGHAIYPNGQRTSSALDGGPARGGAIGRAHEAGCGVDPHSPAATARASSARGTLVSRTSRSARKAMHACIATLHIVALVRASSLMVSRARLCSDTPNLDRSRASHDTHMHEHKRTAVAARSIELKHERLGCCRGLGGARLASARARHGGHWRKLG